MTAYVLFVDDDVANLIVWEAACAERFAVLTASNAEQALQLMREHEVAVILSDQRMPGLTGVQLLERVSREFPNTIRLLITAYSDLHAAVEAINRGGVRRYLQKPCSIEQLRSEIAEAVELYSLRAQAQAVERRLLLTERVYALGLIASGQQHEPGRPAQIIRDSVRLARAEVRSIVNKLDPSASHVGTLRKHLDGLEERLARALLDVERVMELAGHKEMQAQDADTHAVDVVAVLQLALPLARGELCRDANVALELADVPMARGTAQKLSQVVLSLLVNALEAVASLPPAERAIKVRLAAGHDEVLLDVADNGPTIARRDLAQMFNPMHVTESPRRGSLGLAISKALVEEMGGELHVESRPSEGATFRVVLRAAA